MEGFFGVFALEVGDGGGRGFVSVTHPRTRLPDPLHRTLTILRRQLFNFPDIINIFTLFILGNILHYGFLILSLNYGVGFGLVFFEAVYFVEVLEEVAAGLPLLQHRQRLMHMHNHVILRFQVFFELVPFFLQIVILLVGLRAFF